MSDSVTQALTDVLRTLADPRPGQPAGQNIVSAGLVEAVQHRDGMVQVSLRTDRAQAAAMEPVRRAAEALLARQAGVQNAVVVLTAHRTEDEV